MRADRAFERKLPATLEAREQKLVLGAAERQADLVVDLRNWARKRIEAGLHLVVGECLVPAGCRQPALGQD